MRAASAGTGSPSAAAFLYSWRLATRLPEPVTRAVLHAGADIAWALRPAPVRRLEANLRRARPGVGDRALRRLSRKGMQNYLRYYAEAFTLGSVSPERVRARVRPVGDDAVRAELAAGRSVVLALGHQGNWDLAGAWGALDLGFVTTVAERLEPPEVFAEFLRLREGLGMRIIPLDGAEVFRELVRAVRAGGGIVPLLADRDLTRRGIEVDLLGERARVAAGPAALAVTTGAPLVPVTLRHERLRGRRRRAAGSRWGISVTFHPAVTAAQGLPRAEQVRLLTQGWVDVLGADIAAHPTHWHMLQRVFVADLDPERYARTTA